MRELVRSRTSASPTREDCQKALGIEARAAMSTWHVGRRWEARAREVSARVARMLESSLEGGDAARGRTAPTATGGARCCTTRRQRLSLEPPLRDHRHRRPRRRRRFVRGGSDLRLTARTATTRSALEFATAASCLKHHHPWRHQPRERPEVEALMAGESGVLTYHRIGGHATSPRSNPSPASRRRR